jgi:hypothetical protein
LIVQRCPEALIDSHPLEGAFLGSLDPSRPEYNGCSAALRSDTPAAFITISPQFFTAYYFADKVSLMSSLYTPVTTASIIAALA